MIVKAIYKDEKYDYFKDKETLTKRTYGDIFECDDELAEERIKSGFVEKVSKEEEEAYYRSLTTNDDDGVKSKNKDKNEKLKSKTGKKD